MTPQSVIFFGATGYIGGSFLSQLYAKYGLATQERFQITVASRSLQKASKIKGLLPGLEVLSLRLEDVAQVEKECQKYDIVIQLANCDDLEATLAILRGMKSRKDMTGVTSTLIHTSGAAFLLEDLKGHGSKAAVSDTETDRINAIPLNKPHRNVDDAIVKADEAGHIRSYIIVPTIVFGMATGIIHEHGLANQTSMGIGKLIHTSVDRKAVGQIGPGENWWSLVHVDDVASLFLILLEKPPLDHGRTGFYIGENGSVQVKHALRTVAKTLHSMGISETDTPNQYTTVELVIFIIPYWGWNLVARGDRSRALGWDPKYGTEGFEQYMVNETKRLA